MTGFCKDLPHEAQRHRLRFSLFVALLSFVSITASAHEGPFPVGFKKTVLWSGFYLPTAVRFAPDGHVFITEKYGKLYAFDSLTDDNATVVHDFEPDMWSYGDHGLLGLAVDPQWPTRPYLYLMYSLRGKPGGRIIRIEINPATNAMVGNPVVLLEGWCQIYQTHSIGDLRFGPDGALYASSGDGASPNIVDFGEDEPYNVDNNPAGPCTCNDPINEGGSLRSQDLRTSGDPVGLNGTIIRINPDTGAAMPDNPLIGGNTNDDRIIAYGLRNPYRFTIDNVTGALFIGDVGWNGWEEVNYIPNPLATPIRNFGWPCYEGVDVMPAYYYSDLPICNALVSEGAATPPFYTYPHIGGASVTGTAIYEGGNYPAQYVGALFVADYAEHKMRVMYPNAQGVPDPATIEEFASDSISPVDLQVGPEGDLFYIDIGLGSVRRIEYVGNVDPPDAIAESDVTYGPSPLTVQFSALNSTDPNNSPLTYGWDFNNDGDFSDSTDPEPAFTFQTSGNFAVNLKVTNQDLLTDIDTILIAVDNGPPVATITLPDPAYLWRAGDLFTFEGNGTDPDTGAIGPEGMTWDLVLNHCVSLSPPDCHEHYEDTKTGEGTGTFIAVDHEYPCSLDVKLTVTEPGVNGLSNTATLTLFPEVATMTVTSSPVGRTVGIYAQTAPAPLVRQAVVSGTTTLTAPTPQIVADTKYTLVSWSDGGAAAHNITIPDSDTTFTATFSKNERPVLASVGNKSINEGSLLQFNVSATDPDGATPSFTATNMPSGATFTDHGNGTATFSWTPSYSQSGTYANVNIRAVDSADSQWFDAEPITIIVNNFNPAPVVAAIGNKSVNENALLQFTVTASDADGTVPAMTVANAPSGASFVDNGNGTGTFSWTPAFTQQGTYVNVTFTATDTGAPPKTASRSISITVNNVNRAPVLNALGDKSVNENATLQFTVTASDPDGNAPALSATNVPIGAQFVDNGNGTGTFTWTPTFAQQGTYSNITFKASDSDAPPLSDTRSISIAVNNVNQAPALGAIGNKSVNEDASLQFTVSATDPDGTTPALSATNVPTGASFVDNSNGTGTFTWNTNYNDAGVYANVTLKAKDNDASNPQTTTQSITITVNNVNRAPILAAIANQSVDENQILQVNVSVTDADGTVPVLSGQNLPQGATFSDNHNGTGTFVWETDYSDAGAYPGIKIVASDAEDANLIDQKTFTTTVVNVNRKPLIDPISDVTANEGDTVSFDLTASDPDQTLPQLNALDLPQGASFVDHGNGTGTFTWNVDYDASGSSPFAVEFTTTDGEKSASASCSITVTNVNRPVALETIGGKNAVEGQMISFPVFGDDPDGPPLVTATDLPRGAKFVEGANGDFVFTWTPDYHAAEMSPTQVTFTVTDGEFVQSETVEIGVTDASAPGAIIVTKPSSGAVWARKGTQKNKMKWQSAGQAGAKVSLELWRNGQFVAKIKGNTNNDGGFAWDVPGSVSAGAGYVVRVISKSNPLIYGDSGSFTILSTKDSG